VPPNSAPSAPALPDAGVIVTARLSPSAWNEACIGSIEAGIIGAGTAQSPPPVVAPPAAAAVATAVAAAPAAAGCAATIHRLHKSHGRCIIVSPRYNQE
jgi:hypothetical protein